jgi:hypothetical protein
VPSRQVFLFTLVQEEKQVNVVLRAADGRFTPFFSPLVCRRRGHFSQVLRQRKALASMGIGAFPRPGVSGK